jgi:hypothetical protein
MGSPEVIASTKVPRPENRFFLPQAVLDEWIVDGSVELHAGELTVLGENRRYLLTEAVRVLAEVSGSGDTRDLVGRATERATLEGDGAEIVESSMLLGDAAYDIEPGWLAVPIGTFAEHRETQARVPERATRDFGRLAARSDEELLQSLLVRGS